MKPEMRFEGFEGTWRPKVLNELLELFGGNAFQSKDSVDSGVKWLKIANVGFGEITWEAKSFLPASFLSKYPRYTLVADDIVIALTRPIIRNELKIAKIHNDDLPVLLNQRVAKLIIHEGIDKNFIYHLLRKRKVVREIENLISGTDPPNVGNNEMEKIKVFIPAKLEQQKIGAFISLLDRKIEKQQLKVEKLRELKKGMMQKIFSQEIRFKGDNGEKFPVWEKTTFEQVSSSIKYGLNAAAKDFDGVNKYIRITDIEEQTRSYIEAGKVSPTGELTDEYLVNTGDILFARTGASTGKSYMYKETDGKMYFAGFLIKVSVKSSVNHEFIYFQTLTHKYDNWVKVMSMRSGQPGKVGS